MTQTLNRCDWQIKHLFEVCRASLCELSVGFGALFLMETKYRTLVRMSLANGNFCDTNPTHVLSNARSSEGGRVMSAAVAERLRVGGATQIPGELTQPSRRPDPATGRGVRPRSRPPATLGPFVNGRDLQEVRACTADAAPLRLTERGMAVIMVTALMLLVSAVVVIGLTVVRVTGPNYVPYGQTSGVDR
jgi:hypothetical protein